MSRPIPPLHLAHGGIALFAVLAACTGAPPAAAPETPPPAAAPATPPQASPTPSSVVPARPEPPSASASSAKQATTPKAPAASKPAAAKAAPVASASPAPHPPAAGKAAEPALDLKSLEQKLKETDAIGLMTKLSIKNQVDDLVERFRAYHDGRRPPTLPELRRPYELLLMKLLSLLQDRDPGLAKALDGSREAIWVVLSDRDKFSQHSS